MILWIFSCNSAKVSMVSVSSGLVSNVADITTYLVAEFDARVLRRGRRLLEQAALIPGLVGARGIGSTVDAIFWPSSCPRCPSCLNSLDLCTRDYEVFRHIL